MTPFCDCERDGFCQRYHRDMGGRLREICAGVNVDLGTAAAFREQWSREINMIAQPVCTVCGGSGVICLTKGLDAPDDYRACEVCKACSFGLPIPLLLKTDQAPGDAVAMTAAIYSLHQAYPSKYLTAVESKYPEVFAHNPDVVSIETISDAAPIQMHYPAIHKSNERAIHFMQGWCEFLGEALGIAVPLLTNRPQLYFTGPQPHEQGYWVICSGGKRDFTNKSWGHHNYQWVVDKLDSKVMFMQVGEKHSDHPPLLGAINAVGQTDLRDLFELVRRSRGVVCGVSLLMHIAAALEKPAIVIAGGREPVAWNAYPRQQFLHTVGALPCQDAQGRSGGACWRSRVRPLNDGSFLDRDTCQRPVGDFPECMCLIHPQEVVDLVLRYNNQYEG